MVGRVKGNLWQTWTKSKSREDGGALGRASEKRSRYKTGWEETEPRQLCISGWSGLWGQRHGHRNSQENTSWTSAWRKVEGVVGDRHISQKLKGMMLGSCITPAHLYDLETMAMTEKPQDKMQVCENNWVRRNAGVKGIDK